GTGLRVRVRRRRRQLRTRSRHVGARQRKDRERALAMPFKSVTIVRPGLIVPLHGITSRTGWYNVFYGLMRPLLPLFQRVTPGYVTTTKRLGRAMIRIARGGFDRQVLEGQSLG